MYYWFFWDDKELFHVEHFRFTKKLIPMFHVEHWNFLIEIKEYFDWGVSGFRHEMGLVLVRV
jgi:hypothetical protein